MSNSVAIIGSAERTDNELRLLRKNPKLMQQIEKFVLDQIVNKWKLNTRETTLVSGGSSWVDHVAVRLWLQDPTKWKGLELYLPQEWDGCNARYVNKYDGMRLNELHLKFNKSSLSLDELHDAQRLGATCHVISTGFLARNVKIAQNCTHMLAFTFVMNPSQRHQPKIINSGTGYTWNKCLSLFKLHKSLYDFIPIPLPVISTEKIEVKQDILNKGEVGKPPNPNQNQS